MRTSARPRAITLVAASIQGGARLSIRHGHEEADRPRRRGNQFTAEQNQERQVSRLEPRAEKSEKLVSETDQDQRRCQRSNKRTARGRVGESLQLREITQREVLRNQRRGKSRNPKQPQGHHIGEPMRGDIVGKLLRVEVGAGNDDDERGANGLE